MWRELPGEATAHESNVEARALRTVPDRSSNGTGRKKQVSARPLSTVNGVEQMRVGMMKPTWAPGLRSGTGTCP